MSLSASTAFAEEPEATSKTQPDEPKPPAVAAPGEPAEVVVLGERPKPAGTSMTRAEVRELPGAFGDPFRAIEAMPGVTPIISGLPYFYLRGSPPGNVGYFIDGIRVPYLYHFALGPSVVHPALMSRIDVYPGGYPAEFGRFAGGVVAAKTNEPEVELHGEGNIRLVDAGALVEGGFASGRGSALVGGRYSYTAAIISLLAPDASVDYRDVQARLSYDVGPSDRLTFLGFGSYDLIGEVNRRGEVETQFGVEFYRADVKHEHTFSSGGKLTSGVTVGFDQSYLAEDVHAQDRSIGGRLVLERPLDDRTLLRVGADGYVDVYSIAETARVDPDDPDPELTISQLFPTRTDVTVGVHAELRWKPLESFEMIPGLRLDQYFSGSTREIALEPRLTTRLALTETLKLIQAFGIAHQPPSFAVPIAGFQPALGGGLQQSLQNSAGVELDLPERMKLATQLFYNAFFDMTDAIGTGDEVDADQRTLGSAYGFEVSFRRPLTRKLGALVSYTLSRSTRSREREKFVAEFDRTHVVNVAAAYDLGKNWRMGTRLLFYTGIPQSESKFEESVESHPEDPERDPPYFRVDARLEKRWLLGERAFLSLVFEWLNASLQREILNGEPIGPITVPSIGVEGGF